MTEFDIKRVVVACDSAADMVSAMTAAAVLASRHGAPLHGIFFEDENLYRVTELEIAAHVGLSPAYATRALTGTVLKEMLEIRSLGMRRAIKAAAEQQRLTWSFGTTRALSAHALPISDGDMLVVDAGTRPFSGGWRPRSPWLSAVLACDNTVLLRRGQAGHGVAVLAPDEPQECERLIRTTLVLTEQKGATVVLTASPDVRSQIEQFQPADAPPFRFEPRPAEISDVVARLRQLDPNLVVVGVGESLPIKNALVEGTSSDLLFVK